MTAAPKRPTVCVISHLPKAETTTFIRAHIERLPAHVLHLHGSASNGYAEGKTPLQAPFRSGIELEDYQLITSGLGLLEYPVDEGRTDRMDGLFEMRDAHRGAGRDAASRNQGQEDNREASADVHAVPR